MASSVVAVVDPISTGGSVAFEAFKQGYSVIAVWCKELSSDFRAHVPNCCKTDGFMFHAEIDERETVEATAAELKKAAGDMPVIACIVGGESGVTLADHLSSELGVTSNGIFAGGDRRNKSVQQKAVKNAGLRAVREACGKTWSDVESFVLGETFPIVVKPVESCGSDGVKLCKDLQETRDHFQLLMESQRKVGAQGAAVLCQEFLRGTEYVVDHVSRNGVHKTVMVWRYDKRPTNGAAFVYWGMIPVDSQSEEAKILIQYTRGVLDALGLNNGPTHGEVMMTPDGPCLVEMNCRSHGWDGAWVPLAEMLCGYAQPAVALDSHLHPEVFASIPSVMPSPFKASGQAVMLISYFNGEVQSAPGYEKMKQLPSFVELQTGYGKGSTVEVTVDLFTAVGVLMLANSDSEQLERDLAEVRQIEKESIFIFVKEREIARPSSVVAIVDPISTGGSVAFEAFKQGYSVIAVWCNELSSDFRAHVPNCCKTDGFMFYAEVDERETVEATAVELKKAAGDMPVIACIVGGESGVTLADHLSSELGVTSNGIFAGGDRRNKSVQQKAVKNASLRAVREACGKTWSDVESFVLGETFPIVVKPVESCGSDGVKLCKDLQETKDHFQLLMESQRKVGAQGAAVLCQEFLRGTEYVVDHVSRNGVHKTVMVWRYDKRPTNGAAFVYWGMIPVDSQSEEAKILIQYTRGVLDALALNNGPTHGEVMMTPDGPCLVEMNCRSHGWDGAWVPLAEMLCGYAQPAVALDSHLHLEVFASIPSVMPSPFKASGQAVMLISYFEGEVQSAPGYDKMKQLPSFVELQTGYGKGSTVDVTVDLFTAVGVLMLANSDSEQLERDLAEVRQIEKEGIFVFTENRRPSLAAGGA